jgi:cytochrome c oxidase subunit 2
MTLRPTPAVLALLLSILAPGARADGDATLVGVIARQFSWVAQYPGPDGKLGRIADSLVSETNPLGRDPDDPAGKDDVIMEGNEVVVPDDKPVVAQLVSIDMLHNFTVKSLKIDEPVVPGTTHSITFTPKKAGKLALTCSQYCGAGHDKMKGTLRIVPRAEFEAWLQQPMPGTAPAR